MSEIPYFFETPVPKYFRQAGWFDNEKTFKFVTWAFSRCQSVAHKQVFDGRELLLQPFEFICGRSKSSQECFLTQEEFRTQLNWMQNEGLLKKSPNSAPNRFTCYIWVTESFSKVDHQLRHQPSPNRAPTDPHKGDEKKKRSKESHHPLPSSPLPSPPALTDDLFQKKEEEKKQPTLIEVTSGVSMSQSDLDACISIKGSLEGVKHAVEYILKAPGRRRVIKSWPQALSAWQIKSVVKPRLQENEAFGKCLEKEYGLREGWRAIVHNDRRKDVRGILFENSLCANVPSIFIAFVDPEFREKSEKIVKEKRMKKVGVAIDLRPPEIRTETHLQSSIVA